MLKILAMLALAPIAIALLYVIVGFVMDRRREYRRRQRTIRHRAHQMAWDWLMKGRRNRRLPYYPPGSDGSGGGT